MRPRPRQSPERERGRPLRILWQSFLDPRDHAAYVRLLAGRLATLGAERAQFDVVGIRPPDRFVHPLSELRCGLSAIRNVIWAQQAGYDAAVIGHFQELGLDQARAAVEMPVIGVGEAVLHEACVDGEMLGLITIDPSFIPWHEAQLRAWQPSRPVAGVAAMRLGPDEFMAAMDLGPAREEVIKQFESAAAALVDAGADTLIPAGVLPAIALCRDGPLALAGARVPDAVAAAATAALDAVAGKALRSGLQWRSPYPPPPPQALEEFLAATGGPLQPPLR